MDSSLHVRRFDVSLSLARYRWLDRRIKIKRNRPTYRT